METGKEGVDQVHPFSSYIDNPYMIAYEMLNSANNNQLNANITLNYKINRSFDVMFRSGWNGKMISAPSADLSVPPTIYKAITEKNTSPIRNTIMIFSLPTKTIKRKAK
jgi:hypothetical protein